MSRQKGWVGRRGKRPDGNGYYYCRKQNEEADWFRSEPRYDIAGLCGAMFERAYSDLNYVDLHESYHVRTAVAWFRGMPARIPWRLVRAILPFNESCLQELEKRIGDAEAYLAVRHGRTFDTAEEKEIFAIKNSHNIAYAHKKAQA